MMSVWRGSNDGGDSEGYYEDEDGDDNDGDIIGKMVVIIKSPFLPKAEEQRNRRSKKESASEG